jgi:Tfp pilus assembly protein PilN
VRSHNLIPLPRLEARRRRLRLRVWVAAVSVYAAALAVVYTVCLGAWAVDSHDLARQQKATEARVAETRRQIDEVNADLADARRTLRANEVLGGHPDWSLLLMVLARSMNEEVVLRQCDLASLKTVRADDAAETAAPAPADGVDGWRLQMNGFGRTVASVSEFALAIEKTGLFDRVRLLKTIRQPFLAGQATHFQIECDLGTVAEESP